MHCFPGLFTVNGQVETFWNPDYIHRFSTLTAHTPQPLLLLGAHVHFADIRAPRFSNGGDGGSDALLVISPAVSPIFGNNPGYSVVELLGDAAGRSTYTDIFN